MAARRWMVIPVLAVILFATGPSGCGPGGAPGSGCASDADCDDDNACTDDACTDGRCDHSPNTAPCSDGDSCTFADRCLGGICQGTPLDADGDGYVCARCGGDDCDDRDPDIHPSTECDDGDPCTGPDICSDGICRPGELLDRDGDGAAPVECGGDDCDDARAGVGADAAEGPADGSCRDGLDNDCDGLTDSQEAGCDAAADEYADLVDLDGAALVEALYDRVDGHHGLSYDAAREYMFSELDNVDGQVECVYTGEWVATTGVPDSDVMNAEHTWCQSWGADFLPAKSDLHHLFPAKSAANSRRGNLEFGLVVDSTWSRGGSLAGYDERGQYVFEPRDPHKGDAARALFYFAVRYQMRIDDHMEGLLRAWNAQDPPDSDARSRCDAIETRQQNRNPFVDRPGFVDRIDDF